ncbi:MAG: hypothetical protein IIY16_07705 [Oscillospiraceae bacterium]|nr:hypothetical protein [Oscillospiraceae bacterium]
MFTYISTQEKLHVAEVFRLPEFDLSQPSAYHILYRNAVMQNKIKPGTEVNICLPAVSCGALLAALEVRHELPINKVVLGCNENRALVDFIRTGAAEPRDVIHTESPLLDITEYPELEKLPPREEWEGFFTAYSIPARRAKNMRALVEREKNVRIALSTAAAYTALQDHRCVTADGVHALLAALEEG